MRCLYPQLFAGFLARQGCFSWFPFSFLDSFGHWECKSEADCYRWFVCVSIGWCIESGPILPIAPRHFACALLWTVASLCHSSTDPCDFTTRCGWLWHAMTWYIASAGYGLKLWPSNNLQNSLMMSIDVYSNHTFTRISQFRVHLPLKFFLEILKTASESRQEVASVQADPKQMRVWSLASTTPTEECHARTLPLLPGAEKSRTNGDYGWLKGPMLFYGWGWLIQFQVPKLKLPTIYTANTSIIIYYVWAM